MSTPPDLRLSHEAADAAEVDVLVIGTRPGTSTEDGDAEETAAPPVLVGPDGLDAAFDGELASLLALAGAVGTAEEVVKLPTRGAISAPLLLAVGLGPDPASRPADGAAGAPDLAEQVRRASGAAARAFGKTATRIGTTLSALDLAAAVEGTVLGSYTFTEYRTSGDETLRTITFLGSPGGSDAGEQESALLSDAAITARAVCSARDLINTPPNDLYPAEFARRAVELAEAVGVEVEVLDESELAAAGYGGILGVGTGSSRPPRLVRLRHTHPDATKTVALVGKGITFDTGGISIKPAANMDHMTSDMSGAACVVATVCLAAEQNLPRERHRDRADGREHALGHRLPPRRRPDDVRRQDRRGAQHRRRGPPDPRRRDRAGLRGRPGLPGGDLHAHRRPGGGPRRRAPPGSWAARRSATGSPATPTTVGEGAWAMPLPEELRGDLDSRIADIANVTGHRFGGMLVAGLFLREFVAEGVPWAHIDIAGPAFNTGGPHGYTPKGGTGLPVRTLAAVLADVAGQG